ncbi:2-isopropylmalate synthase [Paenibacillus sp. OAS669]|uniref:2-isopropylmalate synthase n=1 Tax=Paenibacillus sp. OAS669 TaxID=2663821 RepID=UPI00178B241D|nr:2-isopropylmalate synthase [Paenibacillus sp. OAS669]MBE1447110.1 isopropylmalate/homocitrate/citramalate synthase [Paenibacillus sp. OAS669]
MKHQPDYFREQFPYSAPPRVLFDGVEVPTAMPDDIFITDTTFRDGQQARPPYTVEQIVTLFDYLHRLSGDNGVIRQSEFFLYSEKDREAAYRCMEKGHRFPEVTAWIRAVKKDFALVKDMGIKETGILTSISDYHIYLKLGLDREKAMMQYLDIVEAALAAGIRPRCHLEDVTRADVYGFVVPFVQRLTELSEQSGIPVKVRLCDTMGYGVSYPGAILPRSVPRLVHALREETGIRSEQLEWHGHNDFYKVMTNAATAWLYGVGGINGTLLGFGERTGNTPIEGLLFEYMGLTGDTSVDTTVITEIADYFERELGYHIPPMTPFVGKQFNVTAAGIHADGVIKNEEIYNIFDTGKLLNRPLGVQVTDKAGAAGVAFWVNKQLGLEGENRLDKKHPSIQAMTAWVADQYKDGRTTSLSDAELLGAAKHFLADLF